MLIFNLQANFDLEKNLRYGIILHYVPEPLNIHVNESLKTSTSLEGFLSSSEKLIFEKKICDFLKYFFVISVYSI